jgi:hypothetical protein
MSAQSTKCVHVLATQEYAPEIREITLPTIRAYADRIGADFNLISERKFPNFPINYERLQIYEAGIPYEWNINVDADMVLGKNLQDITENAPHNMVRVVMAYDAPLYFNLEGNIYFERDGRYKALVDAFIMTHRITHDLWRPLSGTPDDYLHIFKDGNRRRISEFCVSQNLAKYGLHFGGAFSRTDQIFHIGYTSGDTEDAILVAKAKASDWGW